MSAIDLDKLADFLVGDKHFVDFTCFGEALAAGAFSTSQPVDVPAPKSGAQVLQFDDPKYRRRSRPPRR